MLEAIIDNPETAVTDRLRAIDMLGKYGLGTRADVTSDDKQVGRSIDEIYIRIHEKVAEQADIEGMTATAQWERYCAERVKASGTRWNEPKPRSVLLESMEKLKRELEAAPEFCPWDTV